VTSRAPPGAKRTRAVQGVKVACTVWRACKGKERVYRLCWQ